jgi:hypothetical protein
MVLFSPASQDMHDTNVLPIRREKGHSIGTEVITHLQVLSLLPGTSGPHAIFRPRQNRPVSYPSIVFDAVAEICVMHLSEMLNVDEGSLSFEQ